MQAAKTHFSEVTIETAATKVSINKRSKNHQPQNVMRIKSNTIITTETRARIKKHLWKN